jgi:hypothetical protein
MPDNQLPPVPILPTVQVTDRIWLKRDDLYRPFDDVPMNGAKVYQCLNLIGSHLDLIRNDHDGTVFSDNFLGSPQGPIVARVAKHFGLRCIIPVAGALGTAMAHRSMQLVKEWGGEVDVVCKMGLALKWKAPERYGDRFFRVKFGMGADDATVLQSVVEPVRRQAAAFVGKPTEDMTLVVAVGSGVVFGSLLVGMADLGVRFRRVVGIQIAGYDRTPTVKRIVESCGYAMPDAADGKPLFVQADPGVQPFEFIVDKTYAYDRHLDRKVGDVVLDSQYEAKAWDWAMRERLPDNGPVMFYVVGDSNCLR